jgi:cysteine dioxygenase
MKKTSLSEFIEFLDGLKREGFDHRTVEDYLAQRHLDPEQLAPFIFFREETYGRNLVARGKQFELLLMTWLPQQKTPIHDHAGQKCWISVQSGKLTVRNFKPVSKTQGDIIPCGPLAVHSSGESIYMDDESGIHSIANLGSKPAVSLHLYMGPIAQCRVYDETTSKFHWEEMKDLTTADAQLLS